MWQKVALESITAEEESTLTRPYADTKKCYSALEQLKARSTIPQKTVHEFSISNYPSVPSLLNAAHSAAYWWVRSRMCCGKLVAWMMLRTLTAPSSSMSLRMAYSKSGENYGNVSLRSRYSGQEIATCLRVPPVLPRDKPDNRAQRSPVVAVLLVQT